MARSYNNEQVNYITTYSFLAIIFLSLMSCWDTDSPIEQNIVTDNSKVKLSTAEITRIKNLNTHKLKDEYLLSLWHKHQILRAVSYTHLTLPTICSV